MTSPAPALAGPCSLFPINVPSEESTEALRQTLAPLEDVVIDETVNRDGDDSPSEHPEKRQRRQRVLIDMHGNETGRGKAGGPASPENVYERERLERIKRNEEMMRDMGLRAMAVTLATNTLNTAAAGTGTAPRQRAPPKSRRPNGPRPPSVPTRRTRHSSRTDAPGINHEGGDSLDPAATGEEGDGALNALLNNKESEIGKDEDALLTQEEYFKMTGKDISNAVHTDGMYTGWVNPPVAERCGIAGDAETAWAVGEIMPSVNSKGWSKAKVLAFTMLKKNPNCYFYRHVAPGQQQAQGEWNDEEHAAFLRIAKKHGVGDKWGLFASHIPQRIGYQCSSYYREVIIPSGDVIDPRFRLTRSGKAVYVG